MKLVIKSFGQHVDLDDTTAVSHFLLVQDELGRNLHLPVPQETVMELTRFIYAKSGTSQEPALGVIDPFEGLSPEDRERLMEQAEKTSLQTAQTVDATEFGGDVETEEVLSDEEIPPQPDFSHLPDPADPESEDDVPSL